jgi:hypothetical protein
LTSGLGNGFRAQGNGPSVDAAVDRSVTSYNLDNRPLAMGLHIYHPRALYESYDQTGEYGKERDNAFDRPQPSDAIYALDPQAKIPKFVSNHSDKIEPGFLFPIDSDWDSFLIRFYKPTADACIRIGSSCLHYAEVKVGQTVTISGVGSSDGDPNAALLYLEYWWDKDTTMDSPVEKENYMYGQRYEDCVEDCDRDDIDTAFDDPDEDIPVWDFKCAAPRVQNVMLWVWDSHHTNAANGQENTANNGGNHFLHL